MSDAAIIVDRVSKSYRQSAPARLAHARRRGEENAGSSAVFWALREVSCEIRGGSMVGVLGGNGAGKSTLLRLIGGVGRPDSGSIRTRGTIRALLDLGSGMQPDLTGIENTYFFGVVAGLTRREVRRRLDDIVAFAELEEFIESPMRTYSTGMQMRLAFAIAVHTDPGILLVDEVLAVGDLAFQRKCLDRIRQMKEQGCAILYVSHDTVTVRQLCDQALWLRGGEVVIVGPADVVAGQYVAEMSAETRRRTSLAAETGAAPADPRLKLGANRFGSLEMEITGVTLQDRSGRAAGEIESGDPLVVEIRYYAPKPVKSPIFNINLSSEESQAVFDVNTDSKGSMLPTVQGHGRLVLHIDRLDLKSGQYFVNVGAYENAWSYAYDYHWHLYPLGIHASARQFGLLNIPHRWELHVDGLRQNSSTVRKVHPGLTNPESHV